MGMSIWKKYGFAWVTLGLFLFSLVGHWIFGWWSFISEQEAHGEPVEISQYIVIMSRDMFENWQSEFLQLAWQVIGLTYFLYLGSPQSKEEGERLEEKMDAILERVDPEGAKPLIKELDRKYPGRNVGAKASS